MSNSDNGLSDIADIFGVSEDMKNIEDEQNDIVDFNQEIEKLNQTISKEDDKTELKTLEITVVKEDRKPVETIEQTIVQSINKTNFEEQKNKEILVEKVAEKVEEKPINIVEKTIEESTDLIDETDTEDVEESDDVDDENVSRVLEEVVVIEENQKNKADEPKIVETQKDNYVEEVIDFDIPESTEIEWVIKSTDHKFDSFYSEKRDLLKSILVGGVLPFKSLMKELKESYVDISHPTFDTEMASVKMDRVQKVRDRVSQIAIDCNQQYYPWKRAVELMHGLLARTQYEKPAAKQDGLIYEHMKDIEIYFHKLESLHYSIEAIIRNLDGAFDCLSRRATIALPSRPIERKYPSTYENKQEHIEVPVKKIEVQEVIEVPGILSEYDFLPDDAKDKVSENKTFQKKLRKPGKVSYNEI